MAFAQGAVLVLPFPYSDRLAEKRRPAVVVSKPALERAHGVVWVAMITSDRGAHRVDDIAITNLDKAGLPFPSLVRPSKIATIEPERVIRTAGALSQSNLRALLDTIRKQI
jgi:mRNA interferase MazF